MNCQSKSRISFDLGLLLLKHETTPAGVEGSRHINIQDLTLYSSHSTVVLGWNAIQFLPFALLAVVLTGLEFKQALWQMAKEEIILLFE